MSAPGIDHEARRAFLDALAVLAGFSAKPQFPRFRPDVYRCRTSDGAWFIGEAKASEGPGDLDAVGRLGRYVDVCRYCGASALFALAVDVQETRGWRRQLLEALGAGVPVRSSTSGQSALIWAWYTPADGQRVWTGHSTHLGLKARQTSRPCWSAFT